MQHCAEQLKGVTNLSSFCLHFNSGVIDISLAVEPNDLGVILPAEGLLARQKGEEDHADREDIALAVVEGQLLVVLEDFRRDEAWRPATLEQHLALCLSG